MALFTSLPNEFWTGNFCTAFHSDKRMWPNFSNGELKRMRKSERERVRGREREGRERERKK